MVVSKKCKVCTALNDDNISISGGYFDKCLPTIIEKISGIKLDPRKANGVLICKLCVVQLLSADMIIDKIKNTLQRLTKIEKETKPKTPSKEVSANTKSDEHILKPKAIVARRKSVVLNSNPSNIQNGPKENIDHLAASKPDSKESTVETKGLEDQQTANTSEDKQNGQHQGDIKSVDLTKDFGTKVEQITKTPKKVYRRKSVIPKESTTDNNKLQQNSEETNKTEENVLKKSVIHEESTTDNDKLGHHEKLGSTTKFKKILDDEITTVNSTKLQPAKRKQNPKDVESASSNLNISEISEPPPAKRYNSISTSEVFFERSSMDTDADKTDLSIPYKTINCVICGKGFNQKASLREHIESNHMGEKLKQCPNCLTEFRSQQKYESHVFSEKCNSFKHTCQYTKCNRRFKTAYKLKLHIDKKHSSSPQESDVE